MSPDGGARCGSRNFARCECSMARERGWPRTASTSTPGSGPGRATYRRSEDPRNDALGESSKAARRSRLVSGPERDDCHRRRREDPRLHQRIQHHRGDPDRQPRDRRRGMVPGGRPRYRWLNYYLGIAEGEIDETTEEWWIRISAVRNDVAKTPPKIQAAKWRL